MRKNVYLKTTLYNGQYLRATICCARFVLRRKRFMPLLHDFGFVRIRKHFVAVSKVYASTRVWIRCVFEHPHVSVKTMKIRYENPFRCFKKHLHTALLVRSLLYTDHLNSCHVVFSFHVAQKT